MKWRLKRSEDGNNFIAIDHFAFLSGRNGVKTDSLYPQGGKVIKATRLSPVIKGIILLQVELILH